MVGGGRSVVCWHVLLLVLWPFWFGLDDLELTWEVSVINYLIYVSLSYVEIKFFKTKKTIMESEAAVAMLKRAEEKSLSIIGLTDEDSSRHAKCAKELPNENRQRSLM